MRCVSIIKVQQLCSNQLKLNKVITPENPVTKKGENQY
jgi:hypothetical protein